MTEQANHYYNKLKIMGNKQQVLQQAEVKKDIGRDECFMKIINTASSVAENYYGKDKISPAEITFSQDMFCYVTDEANNDVYISRVNEKGVMQATYFGLDTTKDGHIYVQYFKDLLLRNMSEIQDDKEYEAAKKMLQIDEIDKKYLWEARNILKLAVPDADLVLWTSDIASLHITDLNQDHEFKRKLKKTGLI